MSTRAPGRRGFTLLELLVAVSIVAILAGLIMTALRRGRSHGEAAQCLNNLRVLVEANLRFARDNDGRFCLAMDKANKVRWHGVRGGLDDPFNPEKGPLAPYLGKEGRVKICPSFQGFLEGSASFEEGSGGYGYNAAYIGGTPANRWEGERLSNLERPSVTVMFADSAFAKRKGVQEYPFAEPWQWVNWAGELSGPLAPSVHFRHNGHAHVGWCDGHVTAEKPSKLGELNAYGGDSEKHQIGWFGPKEENGYWNPRRESRE